MKPYLSDPDVTLYHGDAGRVLEQFWRADMRIDAIVTSPPYADARRDVEAVTTDEFPDWLAGELYWAQRILAPRGSLFVNIGRRFKDGVESNYASEAVRALCGAGWLKLDELIWFKPNANGMGGPYLRNCHEYVYWLATRPDAYRGLDAVRHPYRDLSRYERGYTQAAKGEPREYHHRTPHPAGARPESVFVCSVGKEKGRAHPTPMPLELAEHLVKLACPRGGTVLDPFMGEGTTGRAARKHGRKFIGIDLNAEYLEMAARRLQQQSLFAESGPESGIVT